MRYCFLFQASVITYAAIRIKRLRLHQLESADAARANRHGALQAALLPLFQPLPPSPLPGRPRFEKDYEDLCDEWLGGLKPEQYRSKILQTQLGRHFEGLQATKLVRKHRHREAAPTATASSSLPSPGNAFFDDYEDFYIRQTQPQLRFRQTAVLREIQQPLELVAYFHKLLGHDQHPSTRRKPRYAARLLETTPSRPSVT